MSEQEIPFGKIKDGKVILSSWGTHPDREIGEVRDGDEAASVQYFQDKYQELEAKITKLEEEIEQSVNKGSFLMKLIHLKELLPVHDGLGDYLDLESRLTQHEAVLQDLIVKNRARNADIKRALVAEVKEAAAKINWREATEEIHEIKTRWIKTGNAPEGEQEELDAEFWGVVEAFFEKKKQFYEDKKLLGAKRKKDYEALVAEAENLKNLHGKERFERVKSLKERWRAVGNIPREEFAPLLQAFNTALKGGKQYPPAFNLQAIIDHLNAIEDGKKPYRFSDLDQYKKQLKAYRPIQREEKALRQTAFRKIQLLLERDFVDKIAGKRQRDFYQQDESEKNKLRITILHELLDRDKTDLATYQANAGNFSVSRGSAMSVVDKKLQQQQNKIEVKEQLMALLQSAQ